MASIIGKTISGQTYYYLREVARVGGKPKIVSQRYLGKAADIEAAVAGATVVADRTRHLAFGDVAAVWEVLGRLRVAETVDEVVGPRRSDAGASAGTYIALAALNRICDPCSKLAFSDWWAKTAADRWVHLPAGALDHRRFWEAMGLLGEERLKEAERRIVAHMVEAFGVELTGLALDMTNFATWIASSNDKAPIAQRGHSKQKRSDLRIVGLGLVVSVDGGTPLVSHSYPGNKPDVTQFPEMVKEMAGRFGHLLGEGTELADRLTLVFDAGQNSDDNFEVLDGLPSHFVGSLPPSDHQELLAVPRASYQPVEGFSGLTAFESGKVVFGKQRRTVVTHSEVLHEKQSQGFDQTLAKARRQLAEVQARLARGKTRKERQKVEAEVAGILRPRWLSRVVSTTLTGEKPSELALRYRTSQRARARLEEEVFGKRVLVTDKTEGLAPTAVIVSDYRSQEAAEEDFRQMKDP
ncbi:MAG: IS1634 family transposase, partial [Acidimicrobiales bacterium]